MRKIFKMLSVTFFGIFMVSMISGCAVATNQMPIREIDRPLNAPAGTKEVSVSMEFNDRGGYRFLSFWDPYFNSVMAYSITDKISLPSFPFPVIQYQIHGRNGDIGDTIKTPGFALAVFGGATAGTDKEIFNIIRPQLGILGKRLLSQKSWLSFILGIRTENLDYVAGNAIFNFGYQIGNKNSIHAGLNFEPYKALTTEIDASTMGENPITSGLFVEFPIGWKLNFFNGWSFDVSLVSGTRFINKTSTAFHFWGSSRLDCIW
jgi:hypothetical protein